MLDPSTGSILAVTTADAAHFDLANDLLDCLASHNSLTFLKLGLLDVGLTAAQREALLGRGVLVASAGWEFEASPPSGMPAGNLAMMSRPFLPKYFPEFQTLVYLDSDTWVQIPRSINDLIAGAMHADLSVVPEMHTSYAHLFSPNSDLRKIHRDAFTFAFGREIPIPADSTVLNSGVFAARANSPVWDCWARSLSGALVRLKNVTFRDGAPLFSVSTPVTHFIEQNALNHAFYSDQFTICPMSSLYNFICTLAMPGYDQATGRLVEPGPPYAPIHIIHLTSTGRSAKQVLGLDGRVYDRTLRWSDWKQTITG